MLFDSHIYDSLFQKRIQLKDKAHELTQRNRVEVGEDVLVRPPDELRDKNEPLEGPVKIVGVHDNRNVILGNGEIVPRERLRRYYPSM